MIVLPIFPQAKGNKAPKQPAVKKCNPFKEDCTKKGSQPAVGTKVVKPSRRSGKKCNPFKEDCKKAKFQPAPSKPTLPPSRGSGKKCNPFKQDCRKVKYQHAPSKPKPPVKIPRLKSPLPLITTLKPPKPQPKKPTPVKPPKIPPTAPPKKTHTRTISSPGEIGNVIRRDIRLQRRIMHAQKYFLKQGLTITGKVKVDMTIAPDGKITSAKIYDNPTDNDAFGKRLLMKLRNYVIRGYKAKKTMNVRVPFYFRME